jgi:hypothetical protein
VRDRSPNWRARIRPCRTRRWPWVPLDWVSHLSSIASDGPAANVAQCPQASKTSRPSAVARRIPAALWDRAWRRVNIAGGCSAGNGADLPDVVPLEVRCARAQDDVEIPHAVVARDRAQHWAAPAGCDRRRWSGRSIDRSEGRRPTTPGAITPPSLFTRRGFGPSTSRTSDTAGLEPGRSLTMVQYIDHCTDAQRVRAAQSSFGER